ncbi:MAG: hypothetical protein WBM75_08785 [Polyangiales bacterium]|jgi:hypothetical protein
MPTAPQPPHALLKRINAWALNDVGFDCAIALDAKNGLIFSFVWNLQD